jgi:hypothetical protein
MGKFTRRAFLEGVAASGATAAAAKRALTEAASARTEREGTNAQLAEIDFRYAPRLQQATICFPNDPKKSLVGQAGDLRYGFTKALNGPSVGVEDFAAICTFSLAGLQDDRVVRQWLEAPSIPIVHTLIERPTATLELLAFATRRADEGRVDNVVMRIRSKQARVAASPRINVRTCLRLKQISGPPTIAVADESTNAPFLVAAKIGPTLDFAALWEEAGYTLYLPHGEASPDEPLQYLIRFPQDGQSVEAVQEMLQHPDVLADEARAFWKEWKPFGSVAWSYPGETGKFLVACARNIQQSREVKNGRLVFQVGPTLYRNLWIVDGNFLLEAARYLGYDQEADEGLLSEWAKQLPTGQIVAAGGGEHWKDTAIAMFTLVRQCELKQDWKFFKDLEPNVRHAIDFLIQLRDKARAGNSTNGRYGLLEPGFADGGIGGIHSEFTNTVWVLAGLKAIAATAERLGMKSLQPARTFYAELRTSFLAAARTEMIRDPRGFSYLPMLAHDDPAWQNPDPWSRPRPQTAQWALSHAIFPGLVFAQDDPIVSGHIALMQACTREDVPAETGWLWHESVWTYNASFAAHVYLWAGLPELADRTFRGFLNHASPLYCWREEQPLQHALLGQDWGDMPHNWASAECVRYLRHMLLLEDGARMRLLEGIISANSAEREPFRLEHTPSRFGRVTLEIEPTAKQGWNMRGALESTRTPQSIEIPISIFGRQFDHLEGASYRLQDQKILIDPQSRSFSVFWR